MASIVQQRRLALLNAENNKKTENENNVLSPKFGRRFTNSKDRSSSPGKDTGNEAKGTGKNSPLLGRYRFGQKNDSINTEKDKQSSSPNKSSGNNRNTVTQKDFRSPGRDVKSQSPGKDLGTKRPSIDSGRVSKFTTKDSRSPGRDIKAKSPAKDYTPKRPSTDYGRVSNLFKKDTKSPSPPKDTRSVRRASRDNVSPFKAKGTSGLSSSALSSKSDSTRQFGSASKTDSMTNKTDETDGEMSPFKSKATISLSSTASASHNGVTEKPTALYNSQTLSSSKSQRGETQKNEKDIHVIKHNAKESHIDSEKETDTTQEGKGKEETTGTPSGEKSEKKPTRFAMRKQRRAKRHRSDGYMLGLELGANSSEDECAPVDHSLGDAINFLQWIRNPTLQNLAKLRRAVKTNDKDWMKEFLEFDGLGLLFQCLKDLSTIQGFHLSDMVLKMECIMCIREVVNSQTGLDCLLQIKGRKDNIFGRRFATGEFPFY